MKSNCFRFEVFRTEDSDVTGPQNVRNCIIVLRIYVNKQDFAILRRWVWPIKRILYPMCFVKFVNLVAGRILLRWVVVWSRRIEGTLGRISAIFSHLDLDLL